VTSSRLYPTRPLLAASVACFRDGRVLLANRGKPPMEALYSLPGGLVEPGETLGEAALRELREETGVVAELVGFVAPVEVIERDPDGRVRLHIVIAAHAARWVSGEAQTGPEARDIRWVPQAEIKSLPTTPGLAAVLDRAFALVREGS
jgi:8-oxo-dGTP diphosphatase